MSDKQKDAEHSTPPDRFNITIDLKIKRVEKDGKPVPHDAPYFVDSHTGWNNTKLDAVMAIQTLLTRANTSLVELGLEQLNLAGFPEMATVLKGQLKS